MILHIYTIIHTLISLVAIFTGFVVLLGLLTGKRLDGWTKWFLTTTVLTSVTGFFFPFHGFTPAIGVGIISLVVLAIAIFARCSRRMLGAWRWVYVVTAVIALYLNVFVLVVQSLPEDSRFACARANPNRATVQAGAARCPGAFCFVGRCRVSSVPPGARKRCLISPGGIFFTKLIYVGV